MNGTKHFGISILVILLFWGITAVHPFLRFSVTSIWLDLLLSIPFVTYGMVVSDLDQHEIKKEGYRTFHVLGDHRSILTHSILPLLPFILATFFGFPRLSTGLASLVLGFHLICDLKFDEEKMVGYWKVNIYGKRLGKMTSWIWLIGNGIGLIMLGVGLAWL